jgi:hypothetical protein
MWRITLFPDQIQSTVLIMALCEAISKMYGSDSIAQNHHIIKNIDSAMFAMKINFSNPLYSLSSETEKSHALEEELERKLHEVGSITYPAIAYDSYWITALSLDKNRTINSDKETLTKSFKELVFETAESF